MTAPPRVTLPVPTDGWYPLGLDPATRGALVAGQYAAAAAAHPALAAEPARAAFTATLATLAEHYAGEGCQLAAVAWDPTSGQPPRAVIQVSVTPWQGDLAALSAQLAPERAGDIGPRMVEVVPLPAGPAVRVRVVADGGEDPAGRQVVTDTVQYWLPLPTRQLTVVAASSTAALDESDETAATLDVLVEHLTLN